MFDKHYRNGNIHIINARKQKSDGHLKEALDSYQKAIEEFKAQGFSLFRDVKGCLVEAYLECGNVYNDIGVINNADNCFKEAQKHRPKYRKALTKSETSTRNLPIESSSSSSTVSSNPLVETTTPAFLPKPEFFTQDPLVISEPQLKIEDVNDIRSIQDLAYYMQSDNHTPEQKQYSTNLAREIIELFAQRKLKKREIINEIAVLASIPNKKFCEELLELCIQEIKNSVILHSEYLIGLTQIIQNMPNSLLITGKVNAGYLVAILRILHSHLKDPHEQDETQLSKILQTICPVLDAMVQVGVKDIIYEELQALLYKQLKKLKDNPTLAYHAHYACQALLRIPSDKKLWQKVMRRTFKIVSGRINLVDSVRNLDQSKLLDAFKDFSEAFEGFDEFVSRIRELFETNQTLRGVEDIRLGVGFEQWYLALRFIDIFIQENQLNKLEQFVRQSPYNKNKWFLIGLCQRLGQLACTQRDLKIQQGAVKFLDDLYQNEFQWGQHPEVKSYAKVMINKVASGENAPNSSIYRNSELLIEARLKLSQTLGAKGEWPPNSTIPFDLISANSQSGNAWIEELESSLSKLTLRKFEIKSFENIQLIGKGGFGKIYEAFSKIIRKKVAIKEVDILDTDTARVFFNELKLHQDVDYDENILRFYGISKKGPQKTEYLMIIEYADGTLRQYLKENFKLLNWDNKLLMAKQLTNAIAYLHEKEIVHNDLHSKNILTINGVIKLADFGLSKKLRDISNSQTANEPLGVIPYIDPQCFKRTAQGFYHKKTKRSDIYSLGVLLWEITSGYPPFSLDCLYGVTPIQILDGLREKSIEGTPQEYIDIYKACWDENPEKRPEIIRVKELLELTDKTVISDTPKILEIIQYHESKYISNTNNLIINDELIKEIELNTLNELYLLIVDQISKGVSNSRLLSCINAFIESNNTTSARVLSLLINYQHIPQNATMLGIFYQNEIGAIREYEKAFLYYLKSAEGEDPVGQCNVGNCYRHGIGTTQNDEKAFQWYLKSAEGGSAHGQCNLGAFYSGGIGTTQDEEKAFKWYLSSAEGGHVVAQFHLGSCYHNGIGTTQNYEKAFRWYLKSAEDGNCNAQHKLANCYQYGVGTLKDEKKAEYWIKRSKN